MNFEEAYTLLESLDEGINDPGIFKAVFTAGGPGSGKSTVADKLGLKVMGMRPINSDTAFENALKKAGLSLKLDTIDPEVIDTMRVKAKSLSNKQLDLAINGRLGLVIDSTARNTTRIAKQKEMLEKLGYETAMLFVDTKLETALERNQMRARSVPEKVVVKSHKEIQANKSKLKSLFGKNYWEIPNDGDMKDLEKNTTKWFSKVKSWAGKLPGNKLVKDWINKVRNMVREEEIISELDLRSPAKRDKSRMQAKLSASEKKLMQKMMANPKTAIRDLQITIDTFRKQMGKATALTKPLIAAQVIKYEKWLDMLTPKGMTPAVAEEIVTTAAIPQGPESIGVSPDGKFAGNPVFDCDDATFSNCIKGKKKYGRWAAYLGKDNPFYSKMQDWMKQSYKNKNFMLRNQKSGAMVWARNPLGEEVEKIDEQRADWKALKSVLGMDAFKFGREVTKNIQKMKRSRFKNVPNPGSHIKSITVKDVRISDPDMPLDSHIAVDFEINYTGATSLINTQSLSITREPEADNGKVVIYKVLSNLSQGTYRMSNRDKPKMIFDSLLQRFYDGHVLPAISSDVKGFAQHYSKK